MTTAAELLPQHLKPSRQGYENTGEQLEQRGLAATTRSTNVGVFCTIDLKVIDFESLVCGSTVLKLQRLRFDDRVGVRWNRLSCHAHLVFARATVAL